jgi:hypothetical protein
LTEYWRVNYSNRFRRTKYLSTFESVAHPGRCGRDMKLPGVGEGVGVMTLPTCGNQEPSHTWEAGAVPVTCCSRWLPVNRFFVVDCCLLYQVACWLLVVTGFFLVDYCRRFLTVNRSLVVQGSLYFCSILQNFFFSFSKDDRVKSKTTLGVLRAVRRRSEPCTELPKSWS